MPVITGIGTLLALALTVPAAGFLAAPLLLWLVVRWLDRRWGTPFIWVWIVIIGLQLDVYFAGLLGISGALTLLYIAARRWLLVGRRRALWRWYSEWLLGGTYIVLVSALVFSLPWSALRTQLLLFSLFIMLEGMLTRWQGRGGAEPYGR